MLAGWLAVAREEMQDIYPFDLPNARMLQTPLQMHAYMYVRVCKCKCWISRKRTPDPEKTRTGKKKKPPNNSQNKTCLTVHALQRKLETPA